jgi:hypothetical protein
MHHDNEVAGASITGLGGGLIVLGSLLPWVTAQAGFVSISRNSMQLGEGNSFSIDGAILLILGIITIVIGITRATRAQMPGFLQRSSVVTGAVAGALAIYDITQVNDLVQRVKSASSLAVASIGVGAWITVVGAVIAVVGGLVLRGSKPGPVPPSGDDVRVMRECPFCKSQIRADASVCPHCQRESPPWQFHEGSWWTKDDRGRDVRFNADSGEWEPLESAGFRPDGN